MRRIGCSSTAAASRATAAREGKRGGLAQGIGRTKGGRNTKLHALSGAKGRPHVLLLTPGNVHDCKVAKLCVEALPASAELVADKGYDSQALREWLDARGTEAVHPITTLILKCRIECSLVLLFTLPQLIPSRRSLPSGSIV
jgi:hypothetical protein